MPSKSYLKAFQALADQCSGLYKLTGENIIVEEIPKEEMKTASGLVIASSMNARQLDTVEDNRPLLVRVLLIGEGYYDTDGKDVPLDVEVGDICLVGKLGVKWMSSIFDVFIQEGATKVGLSKESEIQFNYGSQEALDKCKQVLKENM